MQRSIVSFTSMRKMCECGGIRSVWLGHWFTQGNETLLCKFGVGRSFVSHVESRDPQLTIYNRRAALCDEDVGLRCCTFCGFGSSPGWQICENRTTTGICFSPLTEAGAHDILRAAKQSADSDVLRKVLFGDQVSTRNPQPGGKEPLAQMSNPQVHKHVNRAWKMVLQPLCQV